MHLYYRAPRRPLLRSTIGRLGWRIDSRGSGGYVVAAQSELPHGIYRVADEHAPIPLPRLLTRMLAPPPSPLIPRRFTPISHPDAYAEAALSNQSHRVRAARTGTRHRAVPLAANSLGRLVGAGLLDHDHAHGILLSAAQIHVGVDGFTQAEADRTINDGLTYAAHPTAPAGAGPR
ncbi:bifunctional DNA primase/polymerase [Nocardia sp. CWNU-33]|uniref:bifunctional DNA primase/polymerase n=1 Tax=Nocardia sp. CWNU-33 TaxID=3392117 RepID=UPI00398EF69A